MSSPFGQFTGGFLFFGEAVIICQPSLGQKAVSTNVKRVVGL
jgi:hypothetical protein